MLDFEFEHEITKEYLLERYSEETYFEYYLGIPVTKKLVCSPIRKDNHPTCSFYRNHKGELIFKDFGANMSFNFIGLVMELFNLKYHAAINKIAIDFGLKKQQNHTYKRIDIKESVNKFVDNGPTIIQICKQDFKKEELEWWKGFGITEKILNDYHVYSCKYVFLNGVPRIESTTNHFVFGYYFGKQEGRELWKIYMPMRDSFRFLNNLDSSVLQGYNQIPKEGPLLVITKSMKDVMVMNGLGIPAIAPNSENLFLTKEALEKLKQRFKYIVVFYDNDIPGIRNMRKIKKEFPELNYFYIPRKYNAKDTAEFYKLYGRNKTVLFIKEQLDKLKKYGR